jgi:hypothetical protein
MHSSAETARNIAAAQGTTRPAELLMLQFLAWIAARPRAYDTVMEGWRSSCPRLSIWEDALAEGFVRIEPGADSMGQARVTLTAAGQAHLLSA